MPQYILICNHPFIEDTDDDPDETYYEIVNRRVEHDVPVNDDDLALKWVEDHTKEEVFCLDKKGNPQPVKLVKVLKQF